MYYRATGILAAAIWAMTLSAQTAPQQFPGANAGADRALRDFIKKYGHTQATLRPGQILRRAWPAESNVCAIPLLQIPIPKNLEPMPTLTPRTDLVDNMAVATPIPACEEHTH